MSIWASVDKKLCELVTRLARAGYHHTLDAGFLFLGDEEDLCGHDLAKLLLEFKDKAKVIAEIKCIPNGEVIQ